MDKQPSLFDYYTPPKPEPAGVPTNNRQKPEIDPSKIQAELQELAGNEKVKVKLDKHIDVASSIRQTDQGFVIRLNPTRFRSSQKLEEHLRMCYKAVGED